MHSFPVNDLVVFSQLRWDFDFERPQPILTRMAKHRRVFYVEEPMFTGQRRLEILSRENGVRVIVPQLPVGIPEEAARTELRVLLSAYFADNHIRDFTAWYYNPAALTYSNHLAPAEIIYDCLAENSLDPTEKQQAEEAELLQLADIVFTPGQALREAKMNRHSNCHALPSGVEVSFFREARKVQISPADQAAIPSPRIGYYGDLGETFDFLLLEEAALARPEWNFVILGSIEDEGILPRLPNIHYLGAKHDAELPSYVAGWDLAFLPLVRGASTRFLKTTRMAEYLAAGRPVVATSVRDVVNPYATERLIYIADNGEEFARAAECAIAEALTSRAWLKRVDAFLATMNWDQTVSRMVRQENLARHAKLEAQRLLRQMAMETRLGA